MKFGSQEGWKNSIQEEITRLQKVVSDLLVEKDHVLDEIREQRVGKNIVQKEMEKYQIKVEGLQFSLKNYENNLSERLDAGNKSIVSLTKTEKRLKRKVRMRAKELDEYNAKELIDIDAINIQHSNKMALLLKESTKVSGELETQTKLNNKLKTENEEFKIYKKEEEKKLDDREIEIRRFDRKTRAYAKLLQTKANKNGKN